MSSKILHLFAHPILEKSRVNKALTRGLKSKVTFHDLYELYPDFNIDIDHEKSILLRHDVIIWHHPFYWYSCPPLLKQWIDMVLELGWAYGPGGTALTGKKVIQVITAGGPQVSYASSGYNQFSIREFLAPFQRTATLCHMEYLPPYVVHGTHRLTEEDIRQFKDQFHRMIDLFSEGTPNADWSQYAYMNDYLAVQ